jgi:hypothetical protein
MPLDASTVDAFESLFAESVERGPASPIEYRLSAPKWQFLCYLCDQKDVVLHGSNNPSIAELVPRQSKDVDPFGNREAVYAAADGIWPLYFAVVDRSRPRTSLLNGCTRVTSPAEISGWYYFFSINADVEPGSRWRDGTVYLLSGATFEGQPLRPRHGIELASTQRASLVSVKPLAKLAVTPADFPFLDQVRRHDPVTLRERAYADPGGFPWLDE